MSSSKLSTWGLVALLACGMVVAVACSNSQPDPKPDPQPRNEPAPADPTPSPSAGGPGPGAESGPAIPHEIVERNACLMCHKKGVNKATKIPADHAGRTNADCVRCHQPAR